MKGVRVTAAARLHLGFLDLNGDLGRRFGSIGLAIDAFETCVQLREASRFEALGEERERATRLALRIAQSLGLDATQELIISSAIPAHAGLGSGTQLAIAIASAFRRFAGLPLDARSDARLLDRGARSGVGAALFERGGLVVDAGIGPSAEIPPVVARVDFPSDWRVLLILDPRIEGAHGEAEKQAFARLPRMSADSAGETCRRTLMQILPGAADEGFRGLSAKASLGCKRLSAIISRRFKAAADSPALRSAGSPSGSLRMARAASARAPGDRPASPSRATPTMRTFSSVAPATHASRTCKSKSARRAIAARRSARKKHVSIQ